MAPAAAKAPARTPSIEPNSERMSVAVDAHGIPIGWVIGGANHDDIKLLEPTLDTVAAAGLLTDIETLHLDRGDDCPVIRHRLASLGIVDHEIASRGTKTPGKHQPLYLGLRWIVEATHSWWSNYGQLR